MSLRITDAPPVQRFREIATKFCAVLDDRASYSAPALLRRLQPLLPSLMEAALQLPEPAPEGETDSPANHVERWRPLYTSLGEQLGDYDCYWELFDPCAPSRPRGLSRTIFLTSTLICARVWSCGKVPTRLCGAPSCRSGGFGTRATGATTPSTRSEPFTRS